MSTARELPPADSPTTSKASSNAGSKKISGLKRLTKLFPKRGRELQPKPSVASKDTKDENSARSLAGETTLSFIRKIEEDIGYITVAHTEYNNKLHELLKYSKDKFKAVKSLEGLRELHKAVSELRLLISSNFHVSGDALKKIQLLFKFEQNISKELLETMPRLHNNAAFERSELFKNFESLYNELDIEMKLCLLCFSIFPENAIIKKRLLVQWWVAEGFASEEDANKCIRILMKKGFIEPVKEYRSPFLGCYRMHPFHRCILAKLAERANFFNFDVDGKPTQKFEGSFRACLVGEGLISYEDMKSRPATVDDLAKIHLLINLNEPILDFKPEWFSQMRNVNVLYLGRWKALATDHIEVEEDINFLDGFKNMKYLRFLSLQGVSNIITLPKSILMLKNLKILDLRACQDLEEIPESIGFLKSLTHLDMSECYLLDHMPKSLSSLTNLRVLKGFLVGKNDKTSCTLDDLNKFPYLRKLCIYIISLEEFNTQINNSALSKMPVLRKLTIEWGGDAKDQLLSKLDLNCFPECTTPSYLLRRGTGDQANSQLPSQLEKLDLRGFSESITPSWLNWKVLESLKKLYIRGGKLCDLGQYLGIENLVTWKVQVLRLMYLTEIKIEWTKIQELFPDLRYFEQVSCPKLILFPTDANGIWTHPTKWEELQKTQYYD